MSKYTQADVPEDIKNRFPTLSRVVVGGVSQPPITQSRVIPTTTLRTSTLPLQTSQVFVQPTVQPLEVIQTRFGPRPENAPIYTETDVPEEIRRRFPGLLNINRAPINIPFNQPLAQSTIIPQQYDQQNYEQQPEEQEQQNNEQAYEEEQ